MGKGVSVVLHHSRLLRARARADHLSADRFRQHRAARVVIDAPCVTRATWMPLLREYNALLARYFRGQVVAAMIVGVLTWLGLLIVGFPYSGLVGAVAGVFNLVPYLGLVVSAIPALLIALLSGNVLVSLLKAGAVFLVVQVHRRHGDRAAHCGRIGRAAPGVGDPGACGRKFLLRLCRACCWPCRPAC